MKLALGTAQFGLGYGIAGCRERVPDKEAQQILQRAWDLGIRILDTAPAYGDIEEKLIMLTQNCPFNCVSKIPAVPNHFNGAATENYINQSIRKTYQRLGSRLTTLLFHHSHNLLENMGRIIWESAKTALPNTSIKLGISCYDPDEAKNISTCFPIDAIQLPGNAFDQRVAQFPVSDQTDLYIRSAFLQGLLLLTPEQVSTRLPQAQKAIKNWHDWCRQYSLKPLHAALSIVKSFSNAHYCVVGVNTLSHLEEIAEAWKETPILSAPELALGNSQIIDPRTW